MAGKRRDSITVLLQKFRLRSDSLPGWLPIRQNSSSLLTSTGLSTPEDEAAPLGILNINGGKLETDGHHTIESYPRDDNNSDLGVQNGGESVSDSDIFCPKTDHTVIPIKFTKGKAWKRQRSKERGNDALGVILSALYGKMLLVMGIAFPMSEVISTYIPTSFYDGFYLYLYFGSIAFMMSVYGNKLKQKATKSVRNTFQNRPKCDTIASNDSVQTQSHFQGTSDTEESCAESEELRRHHSAQEGQSHFGSFYLRVGAVAFGIGSMIYSGFEFGQYFELAPETKCHNIMIALTPLVRIIFTFGQMYFIFMNSKIEVTALQLGAQFGLMHMIGTNLCVWLNVLVQETRHEILQFYNPNDGGQRSKDFNLSNVDYRSKRGLLGSHSIYECRRTDIFGSLVQTSSQFLFPCTIEYSLICAAILYVMWRSIVKKRYMMTQGPQGVKRALRAQRPPHHYSVDCAHAHKGLFVGIFAFVMTILSLILFFVLMARPEYQAMAIMEVNVTELVLYTLMTFVVLIGMRQVRELEFTESRNLELDNILLIIGQMGSIIYNVFTIIAGHFTLQESGFLMLVTALASLIQLLVQTLFILDASKRCASTGDQAKRKPGREVVTFLLVANLALWLINTLEKSRADSQTVQLKFYGVWAWTIITQSVMPLAIFYRFHSTVCLCDIWKKAFKLKTTVK